MIKLDIHLITKEHKIGDKTYWYSSKGGRIMLLSLIAGFVAKHFGYIGWSNFGIIAVAVTLCIAWDLITLALFDLKMVRLTNKYLVENAIGKELYCIAAPKSFVDKEMFYIVTTDEDGDHLVVVNTTKNTDIITGAFVQSVPTIFDAAYIPMELSEIIDIVEKENYTGIAYIEGETYNKYDIKALKYMQKALR